MRRPRRVRLVRWALLGVLGVAAWRLLRGSAPPVPEPAAPPAAPPRRGRSAPPGRHRPTRVRPAAVGIVALAMLVVGVAVALGVRHDGASASRLLDGADVPAPIASRLGVGAPMGLGAASIWAPVRHTTQVRARPRIGAPIIARLGALTPEGTPNLVAVTEAVVAGDGGGVWVHIRLAGRTGRALGWVPRETLGGYTAVETRVVVDLTLRTLTLMRRGRVVFQAPVGVGTRAAPTPTGEFYIRNKLTRYRSAFYGPLAFGTSARSPALTDWPAGGFVGIHGTDRPDLIPGAISHGCIRLRNDDLLRLARLLPVGTPVTIR